MKALGFRGKKADGEGFELPHDIQGNHADPAVRGTNTTRAQNQYTNVESYPDVIQQLLEVCLTLNHEARERLLNFAKFESASNLSQ